MKATAMYNQHLSVKRSHTSHPAFPNAADSRYFVEKLVDFALGAAISAGGVAALLFLFILV